MNWRGRPLGSHEMIVQTIAATTTASGPRVHAELDTSAYGTGVRISDAQMGALPLTALPPQQWDAVIAPLLALHHQQPETSLGERRSHRPRLTAPGTGRRPVLTLADRLLATILHQRLALPRSRSLPCSASGPRRSTGASATPASSWNKPDTSSSPAHPLASLDDLSRLAAAEGIVIPS
jgi:hypothetical protein